jgi:hypothetical protein
MTKYELRDALKAKGLFDKTGSRDELWAQAFSMYFKETRRKLSQSCGSCYNTIRNWLNS